MTKVTIIAEGWIQSVGYRAFVKRVASQLGLMGLVRNSLDGTVEVFCEGDLARINNLLQKMDYKGKKDDALSAYVENLSVCREGEKRYLGPWKEYSEFQIDYGFEVQSPVDRALLENLENGTIYVASSRDEFGLLKDEFGMLKDEFSMFRKETNSNFETLKEEFVTFRKETSNNFETMEEKYGSISEEIKKMRTIFGKLADAYIKRQK